MGKLGSHLIKQFTIFNISYCTNSHVNLCNTINIALYSNQRGFNNGLILNHALPKVVIFVRNVLALPHFKAL